MCQLAGKVEIKYWSRLLEIQSYVVQLAGQQTFGRLLLITIVKYLNKASVCVF